MVLAGVSVDRNEASFGGGIHLVNGIASSAVISHCVIVKNRAVKRNLAETCELPGVSGGGKRQLLEGESEEQGDEEVLDAGNVLGAGGGLSVVDGATVVYGTVFDGGLGRAELVGGGISLKWDGWLMVS